MANLSGYLTGTHEAGEAMEQVVHGGRPCEGHGCLRATVNGGVYQYATDGRRLCRACYNRLIDGIQELPHLHVECEAMLGGAGATTMREKITGGSRPGLALNSSAVEARTHILAMLSSWSGLVAEERQLPAPSRQVPALADFLLANLCWLAAHPAAGSLSAEIAQTGKIARRAAHPDAVKRIAVGPCVVPGCLGQLNAILRAGRPGDRTQVRCGDNRDHAWSGHEWTRLRRQLPQAAGGAPECWLAPADVARMWRTPIGTVYRLASEHGWRRITRSGRTYYAESDVHDSFSRREARALRKS